MLIKTSRLDPASLAYLQEIEHSRGNGANGVFVPQSYTPPNPRAGWFWFALFGAAGLGIAAYLCRPTLLDTMNMQQVGYWQAGLAAVGALLLLLGIRRLFRKSPKPPLGAFLYADALHFWDINPERVKVTNLERLLDIDGYNCRASGFYLYTKLVLKFPDRNEEILLTRQESAEEMLRFINCLTVLRRSDNESTRRMAEDSPAFLGALARRLADVGTSGDLGGLNVGPKLPYPSQADEPTSPEPARSLGRAALPWLVAAAVAGVSVPGFPMLDRLILDEHLYAKVPTQDNGDFAPLDYYLQRFPEGRHADAVHDLRDDRRFARALRDAEQKHSPSFLREYLSDLENERHREEAQKRINVFYDEAIAGLKKRAAAQGAKIDKQMFGAVLALLEALKKAERPVVTVGFKATLDAEPKTDVQKMVEKFVYQARLKENTDLARIAQQSAEHTAILPRGRVFDPEQAANRERVILERLRAAVEKVLGADILTLEPVAAGQAPMMEVAYHIYAPGRLYVYTTLITYRQYGTPVTTSKTTKGLLRGYEVNWTITFRPPGDKRTFECKLGSQPANELKYDSDRSDPDWAPYAIILYSGFFDMSSRLIRNFAIEPGPAPSSYKFKEVVVRARR